MLHVNVEGQLLSHELYCLPSIFQILRHACASIEAHQLWTVRSLPSDVSAVRLWYRGRYGLTVHLKHVKQKTVCEEELAAAYQYHRHLFSELQQGSVGRTTGGQGRRPGTRQGGTPCYIIAKVDDCGFTGGTKRPRHFQEHEKGRYSLVMVKTPHNGKHYIVPRGPLSESQLTPMSNMPGREPAITFMEYYRTRYNIDLQRPHDRLQPGFIDKEAPTPMLLDRQMCATCLAVEIEFPVSL